MPRYYNWTTAGPLLLAMQAFQKPLPKVRLNMKAGKRRSFEMMSLIKGGKWVVVQENLHISKIYPHINIHLSYVMA